MGRSDVGERVCIGDPQGEFASRGKVGQRVQHRPIGPDVGDAVSDAAFWGRELGRGPDEGSAVAKRWDEPPKRGQLDEPDAHALRATLDLIDSEIATAGMGVDSIVDRLADVLFVQALRAWCNSEQGTGIGWVAALKVRPLAAAMGAMHSDLAHPWTVAELARVAAMSRSAFAALFKAVTGDSPLTYLTCWRVYRAKTLLRDTDLPLTEIAVGVGYDSDTALSRAFRRFEPLPPGAWRRTHRSGP